MQIQFYTIGIYGRTEDEFFTGLKAHGIQLVIDTRRRRGMRGARHAFGNSTRLQAGLKANRIGYRHALDLAPPEGMRYLQKQADALEGTTGATRHALDDAFAAAYLHQVLDAFDFETFILDLENEGVWRVAFLCVEARPEACHRSLIARRLQERYGAGPVADL